MFCVGLGEPRSNQHLFFGSDQIYCRTVQPMRDAQLCIRRIAYVIEERSQLSVSVSAVFVRIYDIYQLINCARVRT